MRIVRPALICHFFLAKKVLSLEKKKFLYFGFQLFSNFFLAKKVLSLEKKKYECVAKDLTVVILIDNLTNVVFLWAKRRQKARQKRL